MPGIDEILVTAPRHDLWQPDGMLTDRGSTTDWLSGPSNPVSNIGLSLEQLEELLNLDLSFLQNLVLEHANQLAEEASEEVVSEEVGSEEVGSDELAPSYEPPWLEYVDDINLLDFPEELDKVKQNPVLWAKVFPGVPRPAKSPENWDEWFEETLANQDRLALPEGITADMIRDYVNTEGVTAEDVFREMNKAGITIEQLANVLGVDPEVVQAEYSRIAREQFGQDMDYLIENDPWDNLDLPEGVTPEAIIDFVNQEGITPEEIRQAMDSAGITVEQMARVLDIDPEEAQAAYDAATGGAGDLDDETMEKIARGETFGLSPDIVGAAVGLPGAIVGTIQDTMKGVLDWFKNTPGAIVFNPAQGSVSGVWNVGGVNPYIPVPPYTIPNSQTGVGVTTGSSVADRIINEVIGAITGDKPRTGGIFSEGDIKEIMTEVLSEVTGVSGAILQGVFGGDIDQIIGGIMTVGAANHARKLEEENEGIGIGIDLTNPDEEEEEGGGYEDVGIEPEGEDPTQSPDTPETDPVTEGPATGDDTPETDPVTEDPVTEDPVTEGPATGDDAPGSDLSEDDDLLSDEIVNEIVEENGLPDIDAPFEPGEGGGEILDPVERPESQPIADRPVKEEVEEEERGPRPDAPAPVEQEPVERDPIGPRPEVVDDGEPSELPDVPQADERPEIAEGVDPITQQPIEERPVRLDPVDPDPRPDVPVRDPADPVDPSPIGPRPDVPTQTTPSELPDVPQATGRPEIAEGVDPITQQPIEERPVRLDPVDPDPRPDVPTRAPGDPVEPSPIGPRPDAPTQTTPSELPDAPQATGRPEIAQGVDPITQQPIADRPTVVPGETSQLPAQPKPSTPIDVDAAPIGQIPSGPTQTAPSELPPKPVPTERPPVGPGVDPNTTMPIGDMPTVRPDTLGPPLPDRPVNMNENETEEERPPTSGLPGLLGSIGGFGGIQMQQDMFRRSDPLYADIKYIFDRKGRLPQHMREDYDEDDGGELFGRKFGRDERRR